MSQDEEFTQQAVRFATAGGEVVMRHFLGDLKIDHKGAGNLVSEADLESEATIARLIQETFPGHAVLAEEAAAATAPQEHEYLWIVDPLDGTNNFAHGIPHFAISVALYHHQEPVSGVVWNPARQDLYVATRGRGATWNGHGIQVSGEATLAEALVGTGFFYDRGAMMQKTLQSIERLFLNGIHGIRRFATASLDLCQVASGKFGAYFEYELEPWDFAAGRLILEEAGGNATDCNGHSLPLHTTSMLATNALLHAAMLELI